MRHRSPRATAAAGCLAVLLFAACAAPPNTEIAAAQQALAAARTADAERYATDDYRAAADAYRLANEAVMAGDYRLALNRALESRDRALTASRTAETLLARDRENAHRTVADVTALLARATADVDAAERARTPKRTIRDAREALAAADADLQKAGTAITTGNYSDAIAALSGVKERVEKVQSSVKGPRAVQPAKRPRGR